MNSGKVLLGLLAGIAAGATLGILFAPDKGTVTRKKISQKGDEYADELEEKFNSFIDSITQKFETIRKDAAKMVENGKSKMKEMDGELMGAEGKKEEILGRIQVKLGKSKDELHKIVASLWSFAITGRAASQLPVQTSVQLEKDLVEDFQTVSHASKNKSEAILIKNSRFIADFKVRIMTGEVALKARFQKRLIGLEKQSNELRYRLEHSAEIHKDSLPAFKKGWNKDMDHMVRLLLEMNDGQ